MYGYVCVCSKKYFFHVHCTEEAHKTNCKIVNYIIK